MSWQQLLAIEQLARAEQAFWASQPPVACPNDGTPLRPSPPGADSELFCPFDGYRWPRDDISRPSGIGAGSPGGSGSASAASLLDETGTPILSEG